MLIMEHYKGLWNSSYLHNGCFKDIHTLTGEYLSQNGTGETIILFRLKSIKIKKGVVFIHKHGRKDDVRIKLKRLTSYL